MVSYPRVHGQKEQEGCVMKRYVYELAVAPNKKMRRMLDRAADLNR